MLRNFVAFHDAALKAVSQGEVTFAKIKDQAGDIMFKLSQMKFEVRLFGSQMANVSDRVLRAASNTRQGCDQGEDGRAVQRDPGEIPAVGRVKIPKRSAVNHIRCIHVGAWAPFVSTCYIVTLTFCLSWTLSSPRMFPISSQ